MFERFNVSVYGTARCVSMIPLRFVRFDSFNRIGKSIMTTTIQMSYSYLLEQSRAESEQLNHRLLY